MANVITEQKAHRKPEGRSDDVSSRLNSKHVDIGLVDILLDAHRGLRKLDARPARAVLEEYLRSHGIGGFGADGVEELLDLKPPSAYPESAQAAILTTESADGTTNIPYLVYQPQSHYHKDNDFLADSVYVIHVSGNLQLGENVYLAVLHMGRKRHGNSIRSEPEFVLSTYDVSPDPDYDAKKEYEPKKDRRVRLHTTSPRPNGVDAQVRCKRMAASYEMVTRFLDALVVDPRKAMALVDENGVEDSRDGFTMVIEGYSRDGSFKTTKQFFPYDAARPPAKVYASAITHAENNGYGVSGKHEVIAALRHTEEAGRTR